VSGTDIFALDANNQLTTGNPPYSISPYSYRYRATTICLLDVLGRTSLLCGSAATQSRQC
jgi:hypothetical protein